MLSKSGRGFVFAWGAGGENRENFGERREVCVSEMGWLKVLTVSYGFVLSVVPVNSRLAIWLLGNHLIRIALLQSSGVSKKYFKGVYDANGAKSNKKEEYHV